MPAPDVLAPDPLRPPRSPARQLTVVLLVALVSYVAMRLAGGADLDLRVKLLRYASLLGAGALTALLPHHLVPDPRVPLVQVLNRAPEALLGYQLRSWMRPLTLAALPVVLLAFFDLQAPLAHLGAKALHGAQALATVLGAGLYAFGAYATLGPTAQAWQEGRGGPAYERYVASREEVGTSFSVPPGLVPALWTTTRCFLFATLAVVAGGYLAGLAPALMWLPGAALLSYAAVRLGRLRGVFDRHFYHTNAFYREVLGGDGLGALDREPVAYETLYWVPTRWRPAVWASLLQFDRRLPLGRYVALGHALVWVLVWQGAPWAAVTSVLLLLVAGQNAAAYVLTTPDAAPRAFQLTLRPVLHWTLVRFFVNLRWALPLALSLAVVAWASTRLALADVLAWTALDVAVALATAYGVTRAAEGAYRRRLA